MNKNLVRLILTFILSGISFLDACSEWTAIKNELPPEIGSSYLYYTTCREIEIGYHVHQQYFIAAEDPDKYGLFIPMTDLSGDYGIATHWMELPPRPHE